jgi:hypothetical protein
MTFGRFIGEHDALPKRYGFAYRCWSPKWGAMAYPIPLNLVMRWSHHVRLWVQNPLRNDDLSSVIESEMYQKAFQAGRTAEVRDRADRLRKGYR